MRWTYFLFVLLFTVLWLSPVDAAESRIQNKKGRSYQIKADFLNYDHVTETFRGRGNASIVSEDQVLRADSVEYSEKTKEAKAWGNVRFSSGKGWVTGSRIEIDLEEQTGVIYNGTLFLEKNNFYVRGDEIQKTGRASYYVKDNGRFTSCDGDSPSWEITGTDLKVTVEGYGSIKHAALRANSVPVLYVPYMILPAKVERQTGLLMPMVLYSNVNGVEVIQPYFWAIDAHSDATFNVHYMVHRGWKPGLEYRYMVSEASKGTAMFDYLHDDEIDDGTSSSGGFEGFQGDDEDRTNRGRWWLRMKADWELPAAFQAKLDVDVVSDQDYLREFRTIYTGYEYSNDYFKEEFGRELDDKTETVRRNQLNLNRTWDQFSFNAGVRWYDDAIARKNGDDNTNQQNLPIVTFSAAKTQIGASSFYYNLNTSFLHAWREEGTRGYSMDLYPKVFYPMSVFDVLEFEPSLGVRGTLWWVNAYDTASGGEEDRLKSREIFDVKADLSTEIARVFNVGGDSVDKIRHGIRPSVVYDYVPDVEQGDLPDYVSAIEETNLVTYSVTNTLTSRRIKKTPEEEKEQIEVDAWAAWAAEPVSKDHEAEQDIGDLVPQFDYHEFCRLSLSQSYDINKARRDPPAGEARHPFSDVTARLELEPFYSYDVRFVGNATWSPYDGKTDWDTTIDARLNNKRGDWVSTTYRYVKDGSSNILVRTFVHLFSSLTVYWEHERNIKDNQDIKSILGFGYQPQCWSFNVEYTDDRDVNNRQYLFRISLHGLGTYDLGQYKPAEVGSWYGKG